MRRSFFHVKYCNAYWKELLVTKKRNFSGTLRQRRMYFNDPKPPPKKPRVLNFYFPEIQKDHILNSSELFPNAK